MSRSSLHFDQSLTPLYGVAERLSPRVERLLASNPSPFTFRGTGVYLVGNEKEVAVIDPGPDQPGHLEALMTAIGLRKVSHILVTHTHRDHSPAAAALKKATGAKTFAFGPHANSYPLRPSHAPERATATSPTSMLRMRGGGGPVHVEEGADYDFVPDVEIRDGEVIAGDGYTFECVFTPGHTSNHMCYALKEEHALFTGDHVMGWSTTVVAPPDGDMGAYLKSLEKLIARDDRILYPTHGSPVAKPRAFVRAYLTHRRMREKQIARALKQGRDTAELLVDALYRELAPGLRRAAHLTVEAHLKHMIEQGLVKAVGEGRYELSAAR